MLAGAGLKPVSGAGRLTWQTAAGLEGGTLLIGHVHSPVDVDMAPQGVPKSLSEVAQAGYALGRLSTS